VVAAAALASAIPFIVLACGILPQAVIVQEVFGTNLTALPAMWYGGYGVQVGHAYLLLFTYLPSALAHTLLARMDAMTQQLGFAILVYLLYGATLCVILVKASRNGPGSLANPGLFAIALSTTMLERSSYYGLVVTYHKGTELLFVVLALIIMRWLRHELKPRRRTAALLGLLAALFAGTKVSYIVLAGPILLVMAMGDLSTDRLQRVSTFAAALCGGYLLILAAFSLFVPSHLMALLQFMVTSYTSGALVQASPFVRDEVLAFLDPASVYLGCHMLAIVWAVTALAAVICAIRSRFRRLGIILATQLIGAVFLLWQLHVRLAQSTMFDVTIFVTFGVVILMFALRMHKPLKPVAVTIASALVVTFIAGFGSAYSLDAFQRMRERSRLAWEFERYRARFGRIPSVYYVVEGLSQPLLFPSVDFFPIIGASGTMGGTRYLLRFYPLVRIGDPTNPLREPHVAIVPEYLDAIPDTPERRAEWPQMYRRIDVFDAVPAFRQFLRPERPNCRVFQFPEVFDREHLIYITNYATKVTVCPVTSAIQPGARFR
jgi:hypothetical protein